MRKKIFIAIITACICINASAQKDQKDYKQRAQDIKTEIWNKPAEPFAVKTIPADMNNESAVIIATSFDVVNTAKMKMKFSPLGFGAVQRLFYQTTFHERVKVNDKAALEDYSILEYQKKLDKSVSAALVKLYNKQTGLLVQKLLSLMEKKLW